MRIFFPGNSEKNVCMCRMKASKKSKIKGAQFYKVGDKVETIKSDIGAWFTADIIDILPHSKCECQQECQCTYKLLFEGSEDDDEIIVVERKLNEIRQVSYCGIDWDKLEVGMKVALNYNIKKPKQWGHWYDYIIEDIQKRNDVYFLKGTLLIGYEGESQKLPVQIDSDNVAEVLEIRPHATLEEKEMRDYETGVKPDYCKKCKNKPKVKCKTCCCCKCGIKKDFDLTVQCDECADWYHIYCIKPPVDELPDDEDWYCPKCNNETFRAKLQRKLLKKKQRPNSAKRNPPKRRCLEKTTKVAEETTEKTATVSDTKKIEQEVEMKEETKTIPKESKVWNQIKEMYPSYELVKVTVEVMKKKDYEGINPAAEEFINNDIINEHHWLEAKQSLVNGKEAFLEKVEKIFTCAICCELVDDPITLSCKHNFCIDCFFRSLSVNVYNCALCRVDVKHTEHYSINENLKNALALLLGNKRKKQN